MEVGSKGFLEESRGLLEERAGVVAGAEETIVETCPDLGEPAPPASSRTLFHCAHHSSAPLPLLRANFFFVPERSGHVDDIQY